jgi:hypothetical protein
MMQHRRSARVVVISALASAVATVMAPRATAEPVSALTSAVDTVRSASQCPPLQSDPLVERAAQMATQQTSDYVSHRSAAVPFTDPMPALRTIGYTGKTALMVAGYGTSEADAVHGLLLEARDLIPNCTYTQYGASSTRDDGGFNLTSLVLAAP